ncbi:MAG: hypothetical protein ACLSAP_00615 [Oscillospiraceae bacterium]
MHKMKFIVTAVFSLICIACVVLDFSWLCGACCSWRVSRPAALCAGGVSK